MHVLFLYSPTIHTYISIFMLEIIIDSASFNAGRDVFPYRVGVHPAVCGILEAHTSYTLHHDVYGDVTCYRSINSSQGRFSFYIAKLCECDAKSTLHLFVRHFPIGSTLSFANSQLRIRYIYLFCVAQGTRLNSVYKSKVR